MGEGRRNDRFTLIFLRSKLIFLLAPFFVYCQDTLPKAQPKPLIKQKPKEELLIIKGNKYKENANWINAGAGVGYIGKYNVSVPCAGLGWNFRFKNKWYKVGYERTGDISYLGRSNVFFNDFHVALGKRKQGNYYNLSWFAGGSYCTATDLRNLTDPKERAVGIYAEGSAVFKVLYDVGLGLTAYANVNFAAPVFGMRLDLYFSGAFRGKAD